MFIEASDAAPHAKARLISPLLPFGQKSRCLQFWYSMYGHDIDTLNVYAKSGNSLGTVLWTISGNQGRDWQIAQVTIRPGPSYKVSPIPVGLINICSMVPSTHDLHYRVRFEHPRI